MRTSVQARNQPTPRPARLLAIGFVAVWAFAGGTKAAEPQVSGVAKILSVTGLVEFSPAGSTNWYLATTNHVLHGGDQVRTGPRSRATLWLLRANATLPLDQRHQILFRDQAEGTAARVIRGVLEFFHRDPKRFDVETGGVNAAILGTEFAYAVADDGTLTVTLYDGQVDLTDPQGRRLSLTSGEVGIVRPGEAPQRTAILQPGDWSALQWALHYPAILNPGDLAWLAAPAPEIQCAWDLYRRGNLPAALAAYPLDRRPAEPDEQIFLAALLLSIGNVTEAEPWLERAAAAAATSPWPRLAAAHHRLIAAVLRRPIPPAGDDRTATEILASSYVRQSRSRLSEARDLARAATDRAPADGFAWVRLAELEFSLGDHRRALAALGQGLERAPEHGAAHAIHGFALAAQNRISEAQAAFEVALALDGRLGDAWLGRGLCRIRRGDLEEGRANLQTAAAAEPQRSLLRSYLAKAFLEAAPFRTPPLLEKAAHELDLARLLDPRDPTPDLYSALFHQQGNRVNAAVADLERSATLTTNRSVYRSQLLLDQDRAVRSVNLANVYAEAGLADFAVREASRAVNADYANAAGHLILANSYNALRDPRQINLRYETPWLSEFLLANLLAPVGAGSLSQTISQNEYSKLFERDGLRLANQTTYTSNGDWREQAAQAGQFGNFAYALDATYQSELGQRPNADLQALDLTLTFKQQVGPADSLLARVTAGHAESGDVLQRHDPARANLGLRLDERQEPLAALGWNHEWQPGVHTLFLVSPWRDTLSSVDPNLISRSFTREPDGSLSGFGATATPLAEYHSSFTGVSAELLQLWELPSHTLVGGLRVQGGNIDARATLDTPGLSAWDSTFQPRSTADAGFERQSVYAYDQWQLFPWALVTLGAAYDRLTQPVNFRKIPLTDGEATRDLASPKLGLTLTPWTGATVRGAYSRSLGGVSFDQSYRLEPVQVAGFTQTYRSLIPDALMGSVGGQEYETWGIGFDQKFTTQTYLTLAAEELSSSAGQQLGALEYSYPGPGLHHLAATSLLDDLAFRERSLSAAIGQPVGRDLSFTVRYRIAEATLDEALSEGATSLAGLGAHQRSVLQQLELSAVFNHPSGLFARWNSVWTAQSNHGDAGRLSGDNFWQHDVWVGWRFLRRQAEVSLGILNITGQDYRLHPLNNYQETYRDRTLVLSGRFHF